MSKVYETGHAKNVANFETLISFVSGYGAAYNPSRASIQLGNLQAKAAEASNVMNQVNTLLATHGNAIASREVSFKPLQKLSTKMHSALKATEVSTAVIENMTSLKRKVQGKRASAKKTPETVTTLTTEGATNQDPNTKPVVQISSSQLSYDSILDFRQASEEKVYRLSAPIACPVPIAIGIFGKPRQGCAEDYKEKSLGPFGG